MIYVLPDTYILQNIIHHGVWCMVGFWHWHIPTFIITDTMVGFCHGGNMLGNRHHHNHHRHHQNIVIFINSTIFIMIASWSMISLRAVCRRIEGWRSRRRAEVKQWTYQGPDFKILYFEFLYFKKQTSKHTDQDKKGQKTKFKKSD